MRTRHTSYSHLLWLVLISMAMAGCETMSKKECLSADWYQVGYQDGKEGQTRSHIEDITESCAKANVVPDRERYFLGRDTGLREYCTPAHGFYLGKNGTSYSRVCPPETAAGFEASYNKGHRIYDARQYVRYLEADSHKLEDRLSKAESDEEKKHIRNELEELDRRLHSARDTLKFIEDESRDPY